MTALPHPVKSVKSVNPTSVARPLPLALIAAARGAGLDADEGLDARLQALAECFDTRAAALDRDAAFPFENLADLQAEGLLGAVVPLAAGGGGASLATARRIVAAVGRAEPSTALVLSMSYLVQRALARPDSRWPERWRDEVWASAVHAGALANSLRVEPELGSPARGGLPGTLARRTAEGWRLSGHKLYTTGIPALRWLLVYARTDETEPRTGVFLVPREAPGLRVIESWDHLGLRASGSHEVVFEDVPLAADQAVDLRPLAGWASGPEPDAYAWMVTLLGALYDGVARAARQWLLGFLTTRAPGSLGAPLSSLARVQQTVGEIEALLAGNEALLDGLAAAADAGRPPSAIASGLVKHTVSCNAIRVVELALQLSGNHGLSRRNPLERHHRNVMCSRIHTPQSDSALGAAGLAALTAAAGR